MSKFYINDDLRRANDKQPPVEDEDDDAGLNRRPQKSQQLPSQAVQEEDVPSEITLNENDPLLIFLRSQESCIKGSLDKFYTWLVSEDIDSMAALTEAVNDDGYLNEKMKVGDGRDFGVRGFKLQLFKRAVLDHDNTKAPVAAADSTDAKIAELGDKVDNNEEAVVKLEDKVDEENSHQYKVNGLLFENMKKDREQADEKHAASMKTSELLHEAIVTVQKVIVTVNNKVDKNKKKQDDWNEKQDAKVNKMKKEQNQLVKSVKKIERALRCK